MTELILYSSETCKPCKQVEQLLQSLKVTYTKMTVEDHPDEFARQGISSVPVLVCQVNNRAVAQTFGLNVAAVKKLAQMWLGSQ